MKLTIRDLLWLILVAAVAFGWLQSDRRRAAEISDAWRLLNEWKATTADLLVRSGATVFQTEALTPAELQDHPGTQSRRIIFRSEIERQLFQDLNRLGIKPTILEPPSDTKP